jgi:hypothetical protein
MKKFKDFDAKQFLLEHGERVGLGVGGAIALLLIVFGLFMPGHGFFSGSPAENARAMDAITKDVNDQLLNNRPIKDDLPPDDSNRKLIDLDRSRVRATEYPLNALFEGRSLESPKRRVPRVLTPEESRVAHAWVPVETYVFSNNWQDDPEHAEIYMLEKGPDHTPNMGRGGGRPAQGGFGGMMGGGRGGGRPGPGGMGGPGGRMNPASFGTPGSVQYKNFKQAYVARKVPLTDLSKHPDLHLARQLRPVRMAIIAASFPFRQQVAEFRDKLHLQHMRDVFDDEAYKDVGGGKSKKERAFRFLGVNVQRRVLDSTGKELSGWEPLDVASAYRPWMFLTGTRYEPEDPSYRRISPNGLCMPRLLQFHVEPDRAPADGRGGSADVGRGGEGDPGGRRGGGMGGGRMVARGGSNSGDNHYPPIEMQLNRLRQAIADMRRRPRGEQQVGMPEEFSKSKDFDPFNPAGDSAALDEGLKGEAPEDQITVDRRGQPYNGPTDESTGSRDKGPTARRFTAGKSAEKPAEKKEEVLPPSFCLLRVVDVTVEPGKVYQYRLQVRMTNPNEGRDDVADPSWAKVPELVSAWYTVPETVTVPAELEYYAVDEKALDPKYQGPYANLRIDTSRQTFMQIHRYLDAAQIKDMGEEPLFIGEWAVAKRVPVYRGEYVDQIARVELPVWSFPQDEFVIATDKNAELQKNPGIQVNFSHKLRDGTETVLVDFEGGEQFAEIPPKDPDDTKARPTKVRDSGPTDVLLLTPDGKLLGHNSLADASSSERTQREREAEARVNQVKQVMIRKLFRRPTDSPFSGRGAGGGTSTGPGGGG